MTKLLCFPLLGAAILGGCATVDLSEPARVSIEDRTGRAPQNIVVSRSVPQVITASIPAAIQAAQSAGEGGNTGSGVVIEEVAHDMPVVRSMDHLGR